MGARAAAPHATGPLPDLEEYSDGVSVYTEQLPRGWKAGEIPGACLLAGPRLAAGPARPSADGSPAHARPRSRSRSIGSAGSQSSRPRPRPAEALRRGWPRSEGRFATLGRTEATLFGFRRRGQKREILLDLFFSGRGADGRLLQSGGKRRIRRSSSRSRQRPAGAGSRPGRRPGWTPKPPEPLFEEVAGEAGLSRPHRAFQPNAARNVPIPGEHMPPGAAVLDFDGDGRPDLFVPGGDGNRLYRNKGDGTFEDMAQAGCRRPGGRGRRRARVRLRQRRRTDLYVTYLFRPNRLYRNRGDGTFEEVGAKAGVDLDDYCTSAAALDYDRDGLARPLRPGLRPSGPGPNLSADNAPPNHLFHNNGDGTFTDVTKASKTGDTGWGLAAPVGRSGRRRLARPLRRQRLRQQHVPAQQRRRDVYDLAKKGRRSRPGLRHGNGDRRLRRRRKPRLLRLELLVPDETGSCATRAIRCRPFPTPSDARSSGGGSTRCSRAGRRSSATSAADRFERTSEEADVWDTSWSWGCVFVDADLDGRPDLFVVNGMVTGERAPSARSTSGTSCPRVPEVRERHRHRRLRRRLALGPPAQALLPQPRRPPLRRARGGHGPRVRREPARPRRHRRQRRRRAGPLRRGLPAAAGALDEPQSLAGEDARRLARRRSEGPGPLPLHPRRARRDRHGRGRRPLADSGRLGRLLVSLIRSQELYFGLGDHDRGDRVTVRWPSGRTTERRSVPAGTLDLRDEPGNR